MFDAENGTISGNRGDQACFRIWLKQDLFLVVIVKEIFDRFQFFGGNYTWVDK